MCSGMPLAYSLTSVMLTVAVDDVEPGALQRRLQRAQRAAVGAERHHRHVGLVTEDRRR